MRMLIRVVRKSLFDGAFAGAARAHCRFCATRSENLLGNAMARSACESEPPELRCCAWSGRTVPPSNTERWLEIRQYASRRPPLAARNPKKTSEYGMFVGCDQTADRDAPDIWPRAQRHRLGNAPKQQNRDVSAVLINHNCFSPRRAGKRTAGTPKRRRTVPKKL